MPGYVMHYLSARRILDALDVTDENIISEYIKGTFAPDSVLREVKKQSHFWYESDYDKLIRRPDLNMFLKEYRERLTEPFFLGYYMHLYMDRAFLDVYWQEHYSFYDIERKPEEFFDKVHYVRVDNDAEYLRSDFFSDKMYYGDYDRLNPYIFSKYNLSVPPPFTPDIPVKEALSGDSLKNLHKMYGQINNLAVERVPGNVSTEKLYAFDIGQILEFIDSVTVNSINMIKQKELMKH